MSGVPRLGCAPALSVPLSTLSSVTCLQRSQGLCSWHLESLQTKKRSAETGFYAEVSGNPVSTRAREYSLRVSALLSHGCCKRGTRTLCCTHRPQNSQGETFANQALCLGILHQSLHQQTSQPRLPLIFPIWEAGLFRATWSLCAGTSPSPTVLLW